MSSRRISLLDRCISEMDHALRVVTRDPEQNVDMHADDSNEDKLRPQDKALSARLMRVNHSGEVSAQALYRGQALVANSTEQREHLLTAAEEENDQTRKPLSAGPAQDRRILRSTAAAALSARARSRPPDAEPMLQNKQVARVLRLLHERIVQL